MRTILLLMVGLLIPWHNSSASGSNWNQNTDLLPAFCKERAKGITRPDLQSLHYYCAAIFAQVKAQRAVSQRARDSWLRKSVAGMEHWSKYCKKGCILYPELHSRWAWALGEQRKFVEAIRHYQLAIQAKRNYTTAYAGLSDLYVKMKEPDEARKILEKGLKARPGSRKLERRLKKLGK